MILNNAWDEEAKEPPIEVDKYNFIHGFELVDEDNYKG